MPVTIMSTETGPAVDVASRPTPTVVRRDIEGLRAIAVGLVLALHAGLPVAGGFVGVDIFFVISGYLMTTILLREMIGTGSISLLGFYARRAKRLLPAAAAVLVATGVATLLLVPSIRWPDIGKDILASGLYVQNWRLAEVATDYDAQGLAKSPLQHFWSLAVEEQFYLVWPILLLLAAAMTSRRTQDGTETTPGSRRSVTGAMVAALLVLAVPSLIWSIHLTTANPFAAYFVTTTRLWELAVGAAAAMVVLRVRRTMPRPVATAVGWIGLALLVGSAFVLDERTPFPGWAALVPTVGTALVILAGVSPLRFGPGLLLDRAPMQWIGKLSYSLYLWHWPVLVIVAARVGDLSATEGSLVVLLSAIPAYLSFRLIEDPVRTTPRLSGRPWATLQMGAACSLLAVVTSVVVLGATWPPSAPPAPIVVPLGGAGDASAAAGQPSLGALVLAADPRNDPAGAPVDDVDSIIVPTPESAADDVARGDCITKVDEPDPGSCVVGDLDSTVDVVLVGDSHAGQLIGPLTNIATQRAWRLTVYVKQACSFVSGARATQDNGAAYPECDRWNDTVQQRLSDLAPELVIVTTVERGLLDGDAFVGPDAGSDLLRDAYLAAWEPALDAGAAFAAVRDTPTPGFDLPECVAEHGETLTKCTFPRSARTPHDTALEAAATTGGVRVIDLSDAICPTDPCAPVIGGVLVYRDDSHLTATYAATLAPRLDAALADLVPSA